jgi:subtilisin family serine protease
VFCRGDVTLKKIEREILALILMAFFTMTTVSIKSEANLDYGKAWSNGHFPVEKLEPKLWNRIQELKANETTDNEALIIWLSENRIITNKSIEGLKTYVSSLLESSHNASVYRICESLPVIMATVSLKEVESIADYEFIDYIYDNEPGYLALDISKSGIRSSSYFEGIVNYNGSGLSIAIIDTGINIFHPDLDDLDDDPSTNDPKVIQEISFVDWNNDNIADFGPMDNYGHGTHVAGVAALILQAHPDWTPAMVKCAIKGTANLNDLLVWPTPNRFPENDRGKGIVDASRAISCSTEIPPDQAESKYEDHWGNSDAIAYLNGTFRIWAAGTIAGDARAEARLTKAFTPSHDMSNTTFFFGFHDIGYMESDLGYATFYATLKLWQGNTILASTEEQIHQVDWCHAYDANCSHTIQLTYQDKLLAGQQYKLEYGFWTFAHVAWSNFYDVKPSAGVTALYLSAINTIGIGN